MIQYRTSGDSVKIHVESGVGNFTFTHSCGHDYLAGLMRDQYEKHMNSAIESIRRESYNKGWKDAKAKTKKQTWFSGWFLGAVAWRTCGRVCASSAVGATTRRKKLDANGQSL